MGWRRGGLCLVSCSCSVGFSVRGGTREEGRGRGRKGSGTCGVRRRLFVQWVVCVVNGTSPVRVVIMQDRNEEKAKTSIRLQVTRVHRTDIEMNFSLTERLEVLVPMPEGIEKQIPITPTHHGPYLVNPTQSPSHTHSCNGLQDLQKFFLS